MTEQEIKKTKKLNTTTKNLSDSEEGIRINYNNKNVASKKIDILK